ncbi:MAG: hypothetical protein ACRD9W_16845, partial [Terriglobia bacterium]
HACRQSDRLLGGSMPFEFGEHFEKLAIMGIMRLSDVGKYSCLVSDEPFDPLQTARDGANFI